MAIGRRVLFFCTGTVFAIAGFAATNSGSALIEAAKKSDRAAIATLVRQHADLSAAGPDGSTALHWAAQNDDAAIAGILIGAGAHVDVRNRYGAAPLDIACANGDTAIAALLLKAGANPNAATAEGEPPLMAAVRAGNPELVSLLLSHDAQVNAKESWHGETPLMWAAAESRADLIRLLLERGAEVAVSTPAAGFTPSNEGFLPQPFLPAGNFTALMFAVRAGCMDCVGALLDAHANINDALPNGTTVLTVAIANAHFELAALLVEKGADVNANKQGWTPLHQLVWARDPNRHFNLPPAIPTGTVDSLALVKILIEHGADPNARMTKEPGDGFRNWMNRIGATPFILAAKACDAPLMQELKAHGADPALVSKDHTSALMAAAGIGFWPAESPGTEEESLAAVRLAFELGNDVNGVNDEGFTAMHGAAVHGANSVVQFLWDHGATLDVKTKKEGWLPVTIADGVFIANTYKSTPQTAVLMRRLMADAGSRPR